MLVAISTKSVKTWMTVRYATVSYCGLIYFLWVSIFVDWGKLAFA